MSVTMLKLEWQALLPDPALITELYASSADLNPLPITHLLSRLQEAITLFCLGSCSRFMLIHADDGLEQLSWLAKFVENVPHSTDKVYGAGYQIENNQVQCYPATSKKDNFAAQAYCLFAEWVENEQLFGCLRTQQHHLAQSHTPQPPSLRASLQQNCYQLSPGLVHQANGGVLILPLRTLLMQPKLWFRLKQMVTEQRFQWSSSDEARPLPLSIPDMLLDLHIILVGTATDLADFQEMEPALSERASYGEFEHQLLLQEQEDLLRWCRYVLYLAGHYQLPALDRDIWPILLRTAIRYSGAHYLLPLSPLWISDLLYTANHYAKQQGADKINGQALQQSLKQKEWQLSYLPEKLQSEIISGQLAITTEGQITGQINGLSVLEFPGYPHTIGEPSRISCVVRVGDGEVSDVERKVELAGNLHAKGMLIIEAFLISALELDSPFPFTASMVFEQSYGEIDGDSASLAELCVFISALSQQPLYQSIAVTGSIDQFGNVQPVGAINEKIEGFFALCQLRGLTGEQGVILPTANLVNLCLNDQVINAVRIGQFHLWPVKSAAEALPILSGIPYRSDDTLSLLAIIQGRIAQAVALDKRRLPRGLRWLSWFRIC